MAIWELTGNSYSNAAMNMYIESGGSQQAIAATSTVMTVRPIPSTDKYRINNITDTGFVFGKSDAGYLNHAYFALG